MKKITKSYYIASALLLIWAITDFYHYVTLDKDLVSYYSGENIILELLQNKLCQGIIKLLLSVLILAFGRIIARTKKQLTSLTAITILLSLSMIVSWAAGMYCLTAVTAEYAATRYLSGYDSFASTIARGSFEHWLGKGNSSIYENYDINRLWQAADNGGRADAFNEARFTFDRFLNRPNSNKLYSATAIYDASGTLLECSWNDYFYFQYLTEEQWQNQEERSGNYARAFFNRNMLTEIGKEIVCDSSMFSDCSAMRFIGIFDGTEFTPQKIEYIDWDEFDDALSSKGSGPYTISQVVEDYNLHWHTLYEDVSDVSSTSNIVTFYSDSFDVCYNQTSPSFSYKGTDYKSLDSLIGKLGPELAAGMNTLIFFDGLDLLIPSVNYCISIDDETYYTPYYYGEEKTTTLHFYTVSAVYCSPWRTALGELRFVYLVTLLFAIVLVIIVRSVIKRHLIQPIRAIGNAMANGEDRILLYPENTNTWYETQLLHDGFSKCSDKMQMQKDDITRLNTALEYAKTAEENRRKITSNIAHELKTPLAVIHSYAEGLKEHIAEDKRDKYIDVILAEAARTDSMVLEMLDLSRLEAGKVKLSRDEFSLIALTKTIFEKLEMAAQIKKLQIIFSFPDDFTITADETRIAQVIENFVTNAIKYTPNGGHILVTIQTTSFGTHFRIENDSTPFSVQELSKVWDSFYRKDEARSGGGTGLGLAIAKNIIELHGGKCSVRNTKTGVEFQFIL